jgi:two-component system osmolarity sensor histidine kinase EnvZ
MDRLGSRIKSLLPQGLLGRSLVILVTPLVVVQLVSAYVFFGTHWDVVTRHLAAGLAGDIQAVIMMIRSDPTDQGREHAFNIANASMDLHITFEDGKVLPRTGMVGAAPEIQNDLIGYSLEANLTNALATIVGKPAFIDAKTYPREVEIDVQLADGVLVIRAPKRRLYSPTTTVFVLWTVGTSMLLCGIAMLFMRNQVRSVRRLAAAANSFGKGRDVADFKHGGASEVRQAAAAFDLMRDRIKRQIDQRTEMLAGVSHDLRTPLTRMKLQLAMMTGDGLAELGADVAEMERMIEGYLAFARGEGSEPPVPTDLAGLINTTAANLRREGAIIDLHCEEDLTLTLRPDAISRCLMNLLGNAARYGRHVSVRAGWRGDSAEIVIDDDGPGIPESRREDVFKPFVRLDQSRNPKTGGVGLGLTIARDIVRGHGGNLSLDDSPLGGLRALVRLPR